MRRILLIVQLQLTSVTLLLQFGALFVTVSLLSCYCTDFAVAFSIFCHNLVRFSDCFECDVTSTS